MRKRAPTQRPSSTISVDDQRVVDGASRSERGDPLPQRPADLAAGRIAGMQDAARRCAPPSRPSASSPSGVAVEGRAPVDQLAHIARAVLDQHRHRRLVAQPVAGRERVGACSAGRIAGAMAAAMPPCA